MRPVSIVTIALVCAAVAFSAGCKKSESSMLPLLVALGGTEIYAGSSPEGAFIELSINKKDKTVTYTDHTANSNAGATYGPFSYVKIDATDVLLAGGFSIFYKAVLTPVPDEFLDGDYAYWVEIPGVAVILGFFNASNVPLAPPTFAFARNDISRSAYCEKSLNWMHMTTDGFEDKPEALCGFIATDSAGTPMGQLYSAEYSVRQNLASMLGTPDPLMIELFDKDTASLALVDWGGYPAGTWTDAIIIIGDPSLASQVLFGPNRGSGTAFTINQASSKDYQAAYGGTYAGIVYQYDYSGTDYSVLKVTVVITSAGYVKVYNFGDNTSTDSPFYDQAMIPLEDFTPPGATEPLHETLYTKSGIDSATFDGIKTANLCHGAFISAQKNGSDQIEKVLIVTFDPKGKFAGFHLYDMGTNLGDDIDDIMSIGLAVKDNNFVNL